MVVKRSLSLFVLGAPLLLGINEANATSSYTQQITNYCSSSGSSLDSAYSSNTCDAACHQNPQGKSAYLSGNLDYFCASAPQLVCTDADGDGYYAEGTDCGTPADFNDGNSAAYPGAVENCSDGVDNDGNGFVDSADPGAVGCSSTVVCTDVDGDGFSTEGGSCGPIDCDDNNSAVNPGAVEACADGIDNNCNGMIDTADRNAIACTVGCTDQDGDGFSPDGGSCGPIDCNDADSAVNPGALEICNDGIDNNCNSRIDSADGVCQDPQSGSSHWWRPSPDSSCNTTGGNTGDTGGNTGGDTGGNTGGDTGGDTGFIHPFDWTDPERQHRSYADDNGVSECVSCHSIDSGSKGSDLSCYNCHGKEWDDPSNTGGGSSDNDDEDRSDSEDDNERSRDSERRSERSDRRRRDD